MQVRTLRARSRVRIRRGRARGSIGKPTVGFQFGSNVSIPNCSLSLVSLTSGAIGFAELGKHISEAWKSLNEQDRAPFQAEAEKEKERYQRQLGDMSGHPSSNEIADNMKRGTSHMPLEARDSSPTHADRKSKSSSHCADLYDREYNESIDTESSRPKSVMHHHSGYNYPVISVRQPPATYFDYYGCASSAFVPPNPAAGLPHGYTPHYLRYSNYRPPTPNKEEDTTGRNSQQQTAHAFSPPYPTHQYNGQMEPFYTLHPNHEKSAAGPRVDNLASELEPAGPRDFAFQCEVCNCAVFSTYQECANHEEECSRKHPLESPANQKGPPRDSGKSGGVCSNRGEKKMLNSQKIKKAEVEEQKQVVEAVMMLKKPIE